MLFILISLLTFNIWYLNIHRGYDASYLLHANTLRVYSQRVAKHAEETITGNPESYILLKKNADVFTESLNILLYGSRDGNGEDYLPPSPPVIQDLELKKITVEWNNTKPKVDLILSNESTLRKAMEMSNIYSKIMEKIEVHTRKIMLQTVDAAANDDGEKNLALDLKAMIPILQDAEKVKEELMDILDPSSSNPIPEDFSEAVDRLENNLDNIIHDNNNAKISAKFVAIKDNFQTIKTNVDNIISAGKLLDIIYAAKNYIFKDSVPLLDSATELDQAYRSYAKHRVINELSVYILNVLTLFCMLSWFYLLSQNSKLNLRITEEKNKKIQDEIQKLIDELTGLAKGDLTVHISEKEGLTKEIAKAINYSINALRYVVFSINKTTIESSKVADEATKIAKVLAASTENQAQEISETTNSVHSMVTSIERVSSNAAKSKNVALESVKIANDGGEVVRDTIQGMERIRDQIADTSEKVRRLSESSQQIGEIVSLIHGIAEQTNILSLNASIQAAMAGDAGRGFAVVADEVQQLAERASYATKEIDTLVKSIQTDTQQVISAMEQTRTGVVQGVELAQDAGSALEKIEQVSNYLSELVQGISASAEEQAAMSNSISGTMNDIKNIANEAATGTVNTAKYIAKLSQLMADLRHSVAEFKLPKRNHEPRE
jgi:twitching motility protein PilJ